MKQHSIGDGIYKGQFERTPFLQVLVTAIVTHGAGHRCSSPDTMNKLNLSAITIPSIPGIPPLPQIVKKPPVPLPMSLFYLTCGSTFVSFIFLPVSLLDLGYLSSCVNPPMVIFTILFHAATLIIAQRKRIPKAPSYYSTVVLFAFILDIGWFISFIASVVVSANADGPYNVKRLREAGLPTSRSNQNFQIIAAIIEFCLIGAFGFKGLMIARAEGDPPSWRPWGDEDDQASIKHSRNGSVGSDDTRVGSLDLEGTKTPSKLEAEVCSSPLLSSASALTSCQVPDIAVMSPTSQRNSFR